jgi:hypothetical protein
MRERKKKNLPQLTTTTKMNQHDDDDGLEEFLGAAIGRLNALTLSQCAASVADTAGDDDNVVVVVTTTLDAIRMLMWQTQTETPGYQENRAALQALTSKTTTTTTTTTTTNSNAAAVVAAAERLDQTARETYARLILEATCRGQLKKNVPPRPPAPDQRRDAVGDTSPAVIVMDDTSWLEFFAMCRAAVQIAAVRDHLRDGTPLFGGGNGVDNSSSSSLAVVCKFPHERLVQVQKHFLTALGIVDTDAAMEYIRQRFFVMDTAVVAVVDNVNDHGNDHDNDDADDPLTGPFRAMVKDLREALQDLLLPLSPANNDDGTTRIVSVHHCEKLIDAETGREIMTFPTATTAASGNINNNNEDAAAAIVVPTTEQMMHHYDHPEESSSSSSSSLLPNSANVSSSSSNNNNNTDNDDHSLSLARALQQVQERLRTELLTMNESDRTALLSRAQTVTATVLRDAMARYDHPSDRIRYLSTRDDETQRLMALQKIWQDMDHGGGRVDNQ